MKMKALMDGADLWDAGLEDYKIAPLPTNPTLNQIKFHKEGVTRKTKAKSCLYFVVSPAIFTRIMRLDYAKAIWDYLKEEYEGDERIRGIKVLNLLREFEQQRMQEGQEVMDYVDKLVRIANKVRIMESNISDERLVQKILVLELEKFEATIASLENTRELSDLKLFEVLGASQAQEQRRILRKEEPVEVKDGWLVDSECTNHMISNETLFRTLDKSVKSRVMIGNGEFIAVEGKGDVMLEGPACTKLISGVLLVPEIDQKLLSVGQLVEKDYKVLFEKGQCVIGDAKEHVLFQIPMREKCFSFNP
ncbi:hypothetical protein CRG98_020946 [Punica granatum]|uniref:Retrovirus-related Pol polyprotein from transposon TNT 1-94-like beta-barrel domain-containing protein n=1 Tax=Punica granatum TaxID=22663 RepID=A0A2I0JS27_PUNGR|nr:hypothetical protein CRG98_020946 [Punica granatum]